MTSSKANEIKTKSVSDVSSSKPGKKGRMAQWPEDMVDDLIDIICESDYVKRELIFTNNKAQKNKEVYESVIKILKERCRNREIPTDFSFTVDQTRVKFKGCVSICKKIALQRKTASGIKNVVEKEGFGAWFMKLFSIVKTRDSCQPEQGIEPSFSSTVANDDLDQGQEIQEDTPVDVEETKTTRV